MEDRTAAVIGASGYTGAEMASWRPSPEFGVGGLDGQRRSMHRRRFHICTALGFRT